MPPKPPVIPRLLLTFFRDKSTHESLIGDYDEIFRMRYAQGNPFKAKLWYWRQVMKAIPSFIIHNIYWTATMVSSYLKITGRTLIRHKGFSIINISGLALSMSICLMIIIYIKDQKNSDRFHENAQRIIRVYTTDNQIRYAEVKGRATTPDLLAPYLEENIPMVEEACRLRQMWGTVLNKETAISITGLYAEPSFLHMFSYPLKQGDAETALNNPFSIIISEETAHKFFGADNPINQTLNLENMGDFIVTGVLKDFNHKSHFIFEALISFATLPTLYNQGLFRDNMNDWTSIGRYYTYLLTETDADLTNLAKQLPEIAKTMIPAPENERYSFKLQRLLDINLGINLGNSMPGTKHSFEIVFIPFLALIIICLACFNYIILSVARSLKRTKEIGLRKVIGARRNEIIKLFLSETFTITFLALATATLLILWLIPAFNGMDVIEQSQMQINMGLLKDPALYLIFFGFAIGVSLVAGLYPALYLSSFQPVNALQGVTKIKGMSYLRTRKILMGIQFAISIISIIFIVYFYDLHIFWSTMDKGIKTDNMVAVSLRDVKHEIFRNEVIGNSQILSISFSDDIPVYGGSSYMKIHRGNENESQYAHSYTVDPLFLSNFGIDLLVGRNFSRTISIDTLNSVLINEQAVTEFGYPTVADAIGETIFRGDGSELNIIGVFKDFNYKSPEDPIGALILRYKPKYFRYANIEYASGMKDETRSFLRATWEKLDKIHPIRLKFYEDAQTERNQAISGPLKISAYACGFVILIALFGLLGMAIYTTEIRIKEIGIRKVLGARVSAITYILSRDYIRLILISSTVGLPGGYFISEMMMQFFAFRPNLNLWVLPGTLVFILTMALLTIGSQTVRAAIANPVETLRDE